MRLAGKLEIVRAPYTVRVSDPPEKQIQSLAAKPILAPHRNG